MVTQMGMSDELGNVDMDFNYSRLSSETKMAIEREVRRFVEEGRERAISILSSKRKELDKLAEALVEYETLSKDEMEKVIRGEKLPNKPTIPANVGIKIPDVLLPPAFGGAGPGLGGAGVGGSGGGGGGKPGGDGGATMS
jgi:ATP-dependent metalloprotease